MVQTSLQSLRVNDFRRLDEHQISELVAIGRFDQSILPRVVASHPRLDQVTTDLFRLASASVIRPFISAKPKDWQLKIMRLLIQAFGLLSAYGVSRCLGYFDSQSQVQLGAVSCKHFGPDSSGIFASRSKPYSLVILAFPGFGGICNTINGWDAPLKNLQKATGAHILYFLYPNMSDQLRSVDQIAALRVALKHLGTHPLFEGKLDDQGRPVGFKFATLSNSYGSLMLASVLQSFSKEACPIQIEASVFQWPFLSIDRQDSSEETVAWSSLIPGGKALNEFTDHCRGTMPVDSTLLNPLKGDMRHFSLNNLIEVGSEDPVMSDGVTLAERLSQRGKNVALIEHSPGFHGGEMTTNFLDWGDRAMARAAGFILKAQSENASVQQAG